MSLGGGLAHACDVEGVAVGSEACPQLTSWLVGEFQPGWVSTEADLLAQLISQRHGVVGRMPLRPGGG